MQGPAVVAANFKVDSKGNMIRAEDSGTVVIGGMKLVPLNQQINLRSHYEQQVFREFNPPTMDDAQYLELLHERGFFAQAHGGGYAGSGERSGER
jgi:hypothetical protein